MEIKCPKCQTVLGKIAGRSISLVNGSFITGQDFDLVVKCNCGEVATAYSKDGIINYGKETENTEPIHSESSGGGGNPEGGETQPNASDGTANGGDTPSPRGTGGGEATGGVLPERPKSWIRGKN